MEQLLEQEKEKLSPIENMYDTIRIVDPVNKRVMAVKNIELIGTGEACYSFWGKQKACNNCASMRAYIEKGTFAKIEYLGSKVFLMISTPVYIDKKMYIMEMLKDISGSGKVIDYAGINAAIDEVNESVIRNWQTWAYNKMYIDARLHVDINSSRLHGNPLSMIMLGIDCLKNINYNGGQALENNIVRKLTGIIRHSTRKNTDWLARYSRDKFLVVLNNTNREGALNVSRRIGRSISETCFECGGIYIKIAPVIDVYCTEDEDADIDNILTGVNNRLKIEKKETNGSTAADKYRLSILKSRIQELRDVLNEICAVSEGQYEDKHRLEVSQYLDELIVEYMKNYR